MTKEFFTSSKAQRGKWLDEAFGATGRAAHILEKDAYIVWTLSVLFSSALKDFITFKGGTSLSKAYLAILRLSEDLDMVYNVCRLMPDMKFSEDGIPPTYQPSKWIKEIRKRLSRWVKSDIVPILQAAMERDGIDAGLEVAEHDNNGLIVLRYQPLRSGSGYVEPSIKIDFSARATGNPCETLPVSCDLASLFPKVSFPETRVRAYMIESTFWEKATAAHVFCKQGKMRKGKDSRHWFDLACLSASPRIRNCLADPSWLDGVIQNKTAYRPERNADKTLIDYRECRNGHLCLVPEGEFLKELRNDYERMAADDVIPSNAPLFADVLKQCAALQDEINVRFAQGTGGAADSSLEGKADVAARAGEDLK